MVTWSRSHSESASSPTSPMLLLFRLNSVMRSNFFPSSERKKAKRWIHPRSPRLFKPSIRRVTPLVFWICSTTVCAPEVDEQGLDQETQIQRYRSLTCLSVQMIVE
jgi:hypothetical protein